MSRTETQTYYSESSKGNISITKRDKNSTPQENIKQINTQKSVGSKNINTLGTTHEQQNHDPEMVKTSNSAKHSRHTENFDSKSKASKQLSTNNPSQIQESPGTNKNFGNKNCVAMENSADVGAISFDISKRALYDQTKSKYLTLTKQTADKLYPSKDPNST